MSLKKIFTFNTKCESRKCQECISNQLELLKKKGKIFSKYDYVKYYIEIKLFSILLWFSCFFYVKHGLLHLPNI